MIRLWLSACCSISDRTCSDASSEITRRGVVFWALGLILGVVSTEFGVSLRYTSSYDDPPRTLSKDEGGRVKAELRGQVHCRGGCTVRKLIEHADFTQGVGAVQVAFLQEAKLPGVEAVELPDGPDALFEAAVCHAVLLVRLERHHE